MEGESIELECAGCKLCVQRNSVCNWAKVAMLRVDEVVSHTRSEFIDVRIVNVRCRSIASTNLDADEPHQRKLTRMPLVMTTVLKTIKSKHTVRHTEPIAICQTNSRIMQTLV